MNRVIKFRAWDKEENKMINNVVPFFNSDGKLECLVFGYSFGGYDFIEVELDKYQHIFTDSEFDKRYVLMQYTGLKDKNGIDIYEGDIVKVTDDDERTDFSDGGIGTVGGLEELYMWYIDGEVQNGLFDIKQNYYIEVIGNIYENPEWLEVHEV